MQEKRNWINYILILFSIIGTAQNECTDDDFFEHLLSYDFEKTSSYLASHDDLSCKKSYKTISQLLYHYGINKDKDSVAVNSLAYNNPLDSISLGYYKLYYGNRNSTPLKLIEQLYLKSKKAKRTHHIRLVLLVYLEIYTRSNSLPYEQFEHYLNQYNDLASTPNQKAWGYYYEHYYHGTSIRNDTANYKRSAIRLRNFYHKNKLRLGKGLKIKLEESIGVYYRVIKQPDSSFYYLNKVMEYKDEPYFRRQKLNIFLDFAALELNRNNFTEAEIHFMNAKKYILGVDSLESIAVWKKFKSEYFYEPQKIYDSAYFNLKTSDSLKLKLNHQKNVRGITEVNTLMRAAEKEAELVETKQKEEANRYIAIALAAGILVVSIIAFLLFKNTKKKQRIAEQEREIEIRNTEKILKEQELTTIDAMIEGQEKERQRLASDLHDSVGATLSAARLQFDHIAKNKDQLDQLDAILTKTGSLLDDAYHEVRAMAHLKNSGVIAKNGLLPAVEKLAKNASGTNKLKVEVQDFGLENRLENSLEITIFRIIQELVTNVIKHANASEATISITQHKDSLNIIVEDNGRGFNPKRIEQHDGMGLSSIEKRIEHLEGTLEVDSTPGNGTSVLIDIPL